MKHSKIEYLEILGTSLNMKKKKIITNRSNIYIEYESNGDRNKTLSVEEYLNNIRPYLKDIINDLKKSDT